MQTPDNSSDPSEAIPEEIEKKEHSFEEGLEAIISTITTLLETKKCVIVAIAGSGANQTNVGKSHLSGALYKTYRQQNLPVITVGDIRYLASPHTKASLAIEIQDANNIKRIIILGDTTTSASTTTNIQELQILKDSQTTRILAAQLTENPKDTGIIRVFISRPDRPITPGELWHNDIIINNIHAQDKPT